MWKPRAAMGGVVLVILFIVLAMSILASMTTAGANRICVTASVTAPVVGGKMASTCAPILPTTFDHPVTVKQCQGSDLAPVRACATISVDLP